MVATEKYVRQTECSMMARQTPWTGSCMLTFSSKLHEKDQKQTKTIHQSRCVAPYKLQRATHDLNGRCQLPLLHTAGGLVGGDQLTLNVSAEPNSLSMITSVAAQKVYGSVGRFQAQPEGQWAAQSCEFNLSPNSDLEWLPQELVLYEGGLYEQQLKVNLSTDASFLGTDVVRLGRTAANETLGFGRWRSSLEISRSTPNGQSWDLIDRFEINDASLETVHGMNHQPVIGSLVWAAPLDLPQASLEASVIKCHEARLGLDGWMACGRLKHGLVARYLGPSSQMARHWFIRIWGITREARGFCAPEIPRVWPLQEQQLDERMFSKNFSEEAFSSK